MVRRNKYKKKGGQIKRFCKSGKRQHKALGGIPMTVVNGKIQYQTYVPHHYTKKYDTKQGIYYEDKESVERRNAIIHHGRGNIARIMIYELRFDIKRETDDERRKREYREWWEGNDRNK